MYAGKGQERTRRGGALQLSSYVSSDRLLSRVYDCLFRHWTFLVYATRRQVFWSARILQAERLRLQTVVPGTIYDPKYNQL